MNRQTIITVAKSIVIIMILLAVVFALRAPAADLNILPNEIKGDYVDSSGLPYFSEMDSYYNLRLTENYVNTGHVGDIDYGNGTQMDMHRYAPDGNVIDYEFWIVVADRPVDINVYLSELELLYNKTSDPAKRKIINQDLSKANMFMNNSVVDTEYFLLFKERNDDVINKRIRNLINNFANAGLTAFQTTNDDLRMILDNFLNGGVTTEFGTVLS